jgi:hypothetical protein
MSELRQIHMIEVPGTATGTRLVSATDLGSALEQVRRRFPRASPRLAIWEDTPPPDEGPNVVVCVPVASFESRRAQAEEVIARWDERWLLIESMPRALREEARRHVVDLISMALLAAAIEGIEAEDDDF